jgi:hypothetical protein
MWREQVGKAEQKKPNLIANDDLVRAVAAGKVLFLLSSLFSLLAFISKPFSFSHCLAPLPLPFLPSLLALSVRQVTTMDELSNIQNVRRAFLLTYGKELLNHVAIGTPSSRF